MPDLKTDHYHLYRRVRLKAIVNTLLGLALIFFAEAAKNAERTSIAQLIPLQLAGVPFLIIGLGIFAGLFDSKHNYIWARRILVLSATYSLFWFIILIISSFTGKNRNGLSVTILWGYWLYNQFYIINDPDWQIASKIGKIREKKSGL